MVGGNIGTLLTNLVLPLVAILGAGNNRKGFSLTLAVFGIVAIIMLVTAFRNLRENNVSELKSIPIKSSIESCKRKLAMDTFSNCKFNLLDWKQCKIICSNILL